MKRLCRRISDGAIFRPSVNPNRTEADMWASFFYKTGEDPEPYYFLGVDWKPRKWYQFRGRWVVNGEIWKPLTSLDTFDVLIAPFEYQILHSKRWRVEVPGKSWTHEDTLRLREESTKGENK